MKYFKDKSANTYLIRVLESDRVESGAEFETSEHNNNEFKSGIIFFYFLQWIILKINQQTEINIGLILELDRVETGA